MSRRETAAQEALLARWPGARFLWSSWMPHTPKLERHPHQQHRGFTLHGYLTPAGSMVLAQEFTDPADGWIFYVQAEP